MIDHEKALNYFQNLFLTAMADKHLAKEETSFLVEVAQQMGISPKEASAIMMKRDNLKFIIPETEEARLAQLEDIVVMMMIDQKIHEQEYDLCLAYAHAVGKSKKELDEIILKTIKGD